MARSAKSDNVLPKKPLAPLPGAVCAQWVRCKKSNCRCTRGTLHGPYYRRFWRAAGRLRSAYVRRRDLGAVRVACAIYRQERYDDRAMMREALRYSRMDAQQLIALLREIEDGTNYAG